jgi:hypothetical protein
MVTMRSITRRNNLL